METVELSREKNHHISAHRTAEAVLSQPAGADLRGYFVVVGKQKMKRWHLIATGVPQ
jgi:hypothetical protein